MLQRIAQGDEFDHLGKIILARKLEADYIMSNAEVVEQADTLCSGRSVRKDMWVQIPPSAPIQAETNHLPFIVLLVNPHFPTGFAVAKTANQVILKLDRNQGCIDKLRNGKCVKSFLTF
jgi:hypothetical protein